MQCYTRAHRYPRTSTMYDYRAPPTSAYKRRHFFRPEPDKIGRPWCPDGERMLPPWQHIKRIQYNPVNGIHRETHMKEMLQHLNATNWTCGQDMQHFGSRKSKLSDTNKYSVQTTYRDHFSGHWLGPEARRHPQRYATIGAVPGLYKTCPYMAPECHPLILKPLIPRDTPDIDPNKSCGRFTVPHYLIDSYPGPKLPEHQSQQQTRRDTVEKMGLVE